MPGKTDTQNLEIYLLKKNSRALEILYEQFAPVLYGIAMKITGDENSAEEVVKETLLEYFNNYTAKSGEGRSMQLSLVNIVRQLACKKSSSQPPKDLLFNISNRNSQHEDPPLFKINGNMTTASEQKKNVLDLVFFGNKNLNDVARELGTEASNVKTLLRDALKKYQQESRMTKIK